MPDGGEVAVVCSAGHLLTIDPATAKETWRFVCPGGLEANRNYANNGMVRYAADGRRIWAYGIRCGAMLVDPVSKRAVFRAPLPKVYGIAESPDGKLVALAADHNFAHVMDIATGKPVIPPLEHPDWTFNVQFSRDGSKLLIGCRDDTARLWDWQARKMLAAYPHGDEAYSARFTPDERFVVVASYDQTARVWDVRTARPVSPAILIGGRGLSLDLTPDGRYAVVGGSTRITSIDLAPLTRPAEGEPDDLIRWAELVSGKRIDHNGVVVLLTRDEWLARWKEYRTRNPTPGL
ncbi:MAG: hypothetical protein L0241_13370 [Planctomycetia bacterium]|nr:hypothetical protein [Planctomycetia bacterium]